MCYDDWMMSFRESNVFDYGGRTVSIEVEEQLPRGGGGGDPEHSVCKGKVNIVFKGKVGWGDCRVVSGSGIMKCFNIYFAGRVREIVYCATKKFPFKVEVKM